MSPRPLTTTLGRLLAFRDHLQEDADARAAYTKIKVDLAPRADADGYLQAKTAFIEATLAGIDVLDLPSSADAALQVQQ